MFVRAIIHIDQTEIHILAVGEPSTRWLIVPLKVIRTKHVRYSRKACRHDAIAFSSRLLIQNAPDGKSRCISIATSIVKRMKGKFCDQKWNLRVGTEGFK